MSNCKIKYICKRQIPAFSCLTPSTTWKSSVDFLVVMGADHPTRYWWKRWMCSIDNCSNPDSKRKECNVLQICTVVGKRCCELSLVRWLGTVHIAGSLPSKLFCFLFFLLISGDSREYWWFGSDNSFSITPVFVPSCSYLMLRMWYEYFKCHFSPWIVP